MRHFGLLGILLIGLSACNGADKIPGDNGSSSAARDASDEPRALAIDPIDRERLPNLAGSEYWKKVREGRLRVIVGRDTPPFAMLVSDKLTGFDVELARMLGKTLGVEIDFISLPTDQVFSALTGAEPRGDLAIANLTRTAERAGLANFSSPYLTVSQAGLVLDRLVSGEQQAGGETPQESFESYFDLAKLPNLIIGVKGNTSPARYARQSFRRAQIIEYPTLAEAFAMLEQGKVQCVVHDDPAIRLWVRQNPRQGYRFKALLESVTRDPICIAMRKGDLEFLRWLDTFIAEAEARGVLADLKRQFIEKMTWLSQ